MARIIPQHTMGEVDRAAWALLKKLPPREAAEQLEIVNNWRAAHSFPLNTLTVLTKLKAPQIDPAAEVVQRIKRLPSILHKLQRFEGLRLSQMQDIGGCRAVLATIDDIWKLNDAFSKSRMRHELAKTDDYLARPQSSGYRGVHLIYKYKSARSPEFNGRKIEIQLRTVLQHAWATAVETVGTFIGDALKSSLGDDQWLRFFKLMGTVIAQQEGTSPVPDTPTDSAELIAELYHIATELDVSTRLRSYRDALQYIQEPLGVTANLKYYLLELNAVDRSVNIRGYEKSDLEEAISDYADAEDRTDIDVVLVSADSVAALQKAYPNYFADTRVFLGLLEDALTGKPLEAELADIIVPADVQWTP